MALSLLISKKAVHPSAVIRRKIARKLREAIRLIVTRGAMPNDTGDQLTFDQQGGGGHKWLLQSLWNHSLAIYALTLAVRPFVSYKANPRGVSRSMAHTYRRFAQCSWYYKANGEKEAYLSVGLTRVSTS